LNGPKTGLDFSVASDLKGGEGKNGIFANLFGWEEEGRREWKEANRRM
jgi:hypothetical protein